VRPSAGWRPRLRARVVLAVAALVTAALAMGVTGTGVASSNTARVSSACTKATARQLVERFELNHFALDNPVAQVLCGPFTGPGSTAMAVTISAPTCFPVQHWAVLAFADGDWRVVLEQPAYLAGPLVAAGSGIRETTVVHRPGDSRCFPSGGTRARVWRWSGSRLVAGPWTQVKRGTPPPTATTPKTDHFKTPSGNIVCLTFLDSGVPGPKQAVVHCGIHSGLKPAPPRRPCQEGGYAGDRVSLLTTGRVDVPPCAGDPGAFVGEEAARVLAYGRSWSGGGLRCTSAMAGLTCRNRDGHGFFLSRERWRAF